MYESSSPLPREVIATNPLSPVRYQLQTTGPDRLGCSRARAHAHWTLHPRQKPQNKEMRHNHASIPPLASSVWGQCRVAQPYTKLLAETNDHSPFWWCRVCSVGLVFWKLFWKSICAAAKAGSLGGHPTPSSLHRPGRPMKTGHLKALCRVVCMVGV